MRKVVLVLAVVTLAVFASEIPEALPEGFLEDLSTFNEIQEDDFLAMMQFARRNPVGTGSSIKHVEKEEKESEE